MKTVLPVLGLLAIIGAWWLATIVFRIEPFLVPSPADVVREFLELPGYLLEQSLITLWEEVSGFGIESKVLMVVLVCIFPIVISTASGMKSTPAELVELFRSLDASRRHEFFKLRLRHALPQVFVGLKVSITLAVIGAVIGEFVGSSAGLGYVINQSGGSANTSLAFAAMALLAIMSVALFYGLAYAERKLLPYA